MIRMTDLVRRSPLSGFVFVFALVLAGCGGSGQQTSDASSPAPTGAEAAGGSGGQSMLVGLAAPFTGEKGFLGPNLRQGVDVAAAEIQEAGGVAAGQLEITDADTEGTAQGATAAVGKLVESDGVNAMLGPTSVTVMSVLDRIQTSGVPTMIIAGTSALDDTIGGETVFRATASDSLVGPAMAQAAVDEGRTECAIVTESLEGAQSVKANIVNAFEELGGTITQQIDIAVGQSSYRSEVLQLLSDPKPDCVFIEISPTSATQFWQNASEFGELSDVLFIGNDVALNEDSIAALQPVVEQVLFIAISPASVGPGRDAYLEAYSKQFPGSEEPVILSDLGYDALNILALAAHTAGSVERADIAAEVQNVSRDGQECLTFAECKELVDAGENIDYEGASGSANIDDTGNSASGFGVFEIRGNAAEQVGEVTQDKVEALVEKLGE